MRKMRLYKREVTDREGLAAIIEACDTLRLGLIDEEGMFIVPVNFGYEWEEEKELRFYFHSASEGRKAEALDKEPTVAFEMDCGHQVICGDYSCEYSLAFSSIMGNGKARKVTTKEEKIHGLQCLMKHMEPGVEASFGDESVERVNVYCIEVTEFSGKRRS